MKIINIKTAIAMCSSILIIGLSGCGSTTGDRSDTQLVGSVVGTPPIAVATIDPSTATIGDTLHVDGSESYDTDGEIVSYVWTYQDLILGEGMTADVSTEGLAAGTYGITLTVTDNEGNTGTDSVEVTLQEPADVPTCLETAGYGTVTLDNGQVWLDRNLGATQVATERNDTAAYGDLYQWGRGADGHEKRDSVTIDGTHATTIEPNTGESWDGLFITIGQSAENYDWTEQNIDSNGSLRYVGWKSANATTQVCPCGYVVPSATDYNDLNQTDIDVLALTHAGFRASDAQEIAVGSEGLYWTRNTLPFDSEEALAFNLYVNDGVESPGFEFPRRTYGLPVRCINPSDSKENEYFPG